MHFDSEWDMNSPKEHGDLSTHSTCCTFPLSRSFSLHIGHCYMKKGPYWTWDELDRGSRWALVVGTGKRGQVEGEGRRQVAWSGARRLPQGAGAREKGTSRPSSLQDACRPAASVDSKAARYPCSREWHPAYISCLSLSFSIPSLVAALAYCRVATHLPTRATIAERELFFLEVASMLDPVPDVHEEPGLQSRKHSLT